VGGHRHQTPCLYLFTLLKKRPVANQLAGSFQKTKLQVDCRNSITTQKTLSTDIAPLDKIFLFYELRELTLVDTARHNLVALPSPKIVGFRLPVSGFKFQVPASLSSFIPHPHPCRVPASGPWFLVPRSFSLPLAIFAVESIFFQNPKSRIKDRLCCFFFLKSVNIYE
jgi:hypothetical protein